MKSLSEPISSRAIIYNHFGEPSRVLCLQTVPKPELKAGQILVKMKKSSINPSDLISIRGTYSNRIILPNTPGYEGVGSVIEQGAGVSFPPVGARVLALGGKGTWQDYVTIAAKEAILIPEQINDDTAAQLYINPLTAWIMINEELSLIAGDTLAVNACGSAFGKVITQFSNIFGYKVIAIVRSDIHTKTLMEMGVKCVVNTKTQALQEIIRKYTKGVGVTAALDAIGGEEGTHLVKSIKKGGLMLNYGLLSGKELPSAVYNKQITGITVKPFWLRDWVYQKDVQYRKSIFSNMMDAFIKYQIVLPVAKYYDISEINEAVLASEKPQKLGKVLLRWE